MRTRYGMMTALLLWIFFLPHGAVCAEKPLWELGMGLAVLRMPHYPGADESRTYLLPYPYFIYRGDVLKVEKEKISGRLFKTDKFLLEFSLFGRAPVDSSQNAARSGMPDLDPTFEIGPALNITLVDQLQDHYKLSLTLPVRAFFSTNLSRLHHEGWVFSPKLVFEKNDLIPDTGLNLGISAGPIFADSSYNGYYHSVDPAYATAARPQYSAGGGYSGSTLTISLNKGFEKLIVTAFVNADFFQGTINESSPLIRRNTSVMCGLAVSWIFLTSAKRVPAGR